jgi:hypothetical protein
MRTRYLPGLCLASLVLVGCERANQREALATNEPATDRSAATQAVEAAQGQRQDPFVTSAEQKLRDLDLKIEELGKKMETLAADAKVEADKALTALREKRAQLAPRIEQLKKSSQQTWDDVKSGVEAAMAEVEKAYENAKSKFGL